MTELALETKKEIKYVIRDYLMLIVPDHTRSRMRIKIFVGLCEHKPRLILFDIDDTLSQLYHPC